MKTKCEVYARNKSGQFITTTGNGRYKRKNINGKNVLLHRYIWEQINGKIPEGYIIHHINMDKFDNRIENLQLMTIKEHNLLHFKDKKPWNTGLNKYNNESVKKISLNKMGHTVGKEQIKKVKKTWFIKYYHKAMSVYLLKQSYFSFEEISKILSISINQAKYRYRKFKKDYINYNQYGVIWHEDSL